MTRAKQLNLFLAVCCLAFEFALSSPPCLAANSDPSGKADLKAALERFQAYAIKSQAAFGVPGMAVAMVAGDKVVYAKGFGNTALKGGHPVDTGTIFQIGSASKAFTGALLAIMVDRRKLVWTDQVIRHYPGFEMKDPWVTRQFQIADLLAQHTGLAPHAAEALPFLGFGRDHIISSLKYLEPATSFRSAYAYQNIPHLVAAKIIQAYTGKEYAQNLKEMIFQPLKMDNASVPKEGLTKAENVTRLHQRMDGKTRLLPRDWPFQNWTYVYAPAGGICADIMDMTQWLRLQINRGEVDGKQLVSQKNMDFLHTPITPTAADIATGALFQYCQGWVYERSAAPYTLIWHNGDTAANHAVVAFMPGRKAGIAILTNLGGVNLADALAHYFCDLYVGAEPMDYCGRELKKLLAEESEPMPQRPKNALGPQPLERYAGSYENPVYGRVQIKKTSKGLQWIIGPKKVVIPLMPWNRDQFVGLDILGSGEPAYFMDFLMDADGTVNRFTVDELKLEAGGVFTRVK